MTDSLTITSVFLLGCFHALEPGHGKTFLLAYTLGGRLDFRKIMLLTTSLLISHFVVLAMISIIFNLVMAEFASDYIHNISHWLGPSIILLFGSYIFTRAIYKSKHTHSDDCGHSHGEFIETKIENPITVGILTGMLPCASSLAVIMLTGLKPTVSDILRFISIYVFGIALVLFLLVLAFNYTKNILLNKISNIQNNLNTELISGSLIIVVGLLYLSYNWVGHFH